MGIDIKNITDLKGKKALVLGLSTTGFAAAKFLLRAGADCFLSDSGSLSEENKSKADFLEKAGAKLEFGGHTEEFIKGAEFCVLSPSIPPECEVLKLLGRLNIPYFSDIELAWLVKPKGTKIVAVTGTNGKTTTTMLISHILGQKYNAPAAGNIGVSPLDFLGLEAAPDYLVIETSSYQLHYIKGFAPDMAVFCNLTPDHISWHGGIENYFADKAKMFYNMDEDAHSILNFDDLRVKALVSKAKRHFFKLNSSGGADDACVKDGTVFYGDKKVIDTNDVPIVGNHNLQNVMCAVIAAYNAGLSLDIIRKGIMSFAAPSHRCEFIAKKAGVSYYNDSKATNPEAAIVAIGAFDGKKVSLIAGGRDKNTSLDEFCALVKERISRVVLIGEAAERFNDALKAVNFEADGRDIVFSKTLDEAIEAARGINPDVVLFSPACASFDMFKNYEVRGEAFRDYVLSKIQ